MNMTVDGAKKCLASERKKKNLRGKNVCVYTMRIPWSLSPLISHLKLCIVR